MIYKSTYGVTPTLSVTIDGASVAYDTINAVEMFLEADKHDMAVIHMTGIPARATSAYRNRPVQIQFDVGGAYVQDFVGYVTDIRPTSRTTDGIANGSPFQIAELVCLGASYAMRGNKSRVWEGYTLASVVEEFARTYGFSADVPQDPLIFSPMIQDSESDWQFMVRYAKMMGYATTLHGTHIHIFNPYKASDRLPSYNKLYSSRDVASSNLPRPGSITNLTATLMDNHPDGVYKDTVVTVHDDSVGQIYDVSLREILGISEPARFLDRLPTSVDSYEQAVRAIYEHVRDKYDFHACVECTGLAGAVPGGVVNVEEYGSEVDGLWYVQSVKHVLTQVLFTTELELRRNVNSELLIRTPTKAFRMPPEARLVNGSWITTKRIIDVYT